MEVLKMNSPLLDALGKEILLFPSYFFIVAKGHVRLVRQVASIGGL